MKPYWETEAPVAIRTPANVFRWYRKAERLQVSLPDWQDGDGKPRPGKTVTVKLDALVQAEDKEALIELLEDLLGDLKGGKRRGHRPR